jgi:hypothetical protein
VALEGNIKTFSLADIFQLIGIQRKTGILTLKKKEESVQVHFENGMVVNAESSSKKLEDRLGTVLVKSGKITQEQLKKALELQQQTMQKMGHILVGQEMLKSEDLQEALQTQVTQTVYRLFRWKDGDYKFVEEKYIDYDKDNFVPMSAESILMEGMRMLDEWPIIERKITSFDMIFEKIGFDAPPRMGAEPSKKEKEEGLNSLLEEGKGAGEKEQEEETAPGIQLSREEEIVYKMIDGKKTVKDVIDRVLLTEFEVCRAFFDLWNRNVIVPIAREVKTKVKPPRRYESLIGNLAKIPVVLLVIWLVISFPFMQKNPYNHFLFPLTNHVPLIDEIKSYVSFFRQERLKKDIELYHWREGEFPASLEDLVKSKIADIASLKDPWGIPYRYQRVGNESFELAAGAKDADGSVGTR